ncbi:selenide, water dikinase SelD [Alcanivorax sp. 1008]|uniref:selenide, water dikinase SelD n=1 Tax=Alcanivorax sp. 1008 TaxID=2816853 RepID=UPI001E3CB1C7
MQPIAAKQDLVLVGGGHSHALALRMLAMDPLPNTRLTLISPDSLSPYSGMLPGLIAGHYQVEDCHVDLPRLCQWAGVRFIRARVVALDTSINQLTLDDDSTLDYDWLSLDIGSTPALDEVPGARQYAIPVKPVAGLRQRWQDTLDHWPAQDRPVRISIVGGGAGGTEMALAIGMALTRRGLSKQITLLCGSRLLHGYPEKLRKAMQHRLTTAGIEVRENTRVTQVDDGILHATGEQPFDLLFWCTGAIGAQWLADSGLALTGKNFVRINQSLQAINQANIFATGDCAMIDNQPLPRAGVYAVRQAPSLVKNLRRAVDGQPLTQWKPQKHFLSLLAAGNRDAAGSRGMFTVQGPWVWRWKDRIDRSFMQQFEQLPDMPMPAPPPQDEIPRCAGCGAKVGSDALQQALSSLQPINRDNIIAGIEAREDASVIRWPAGQLLVQSQDFFPAFIDEPALFARISVLHSLSDIYAMNATPHSALATVTLPVNHQVLQGRDLKRLMYAAVEQLNLAGCALLGGHTLEGTQLAAGFAINGSAREESLFHKGGAKPGDRLILTKPVGTGIILAAMMQLRSRAAALDDTLTSMLISNASAAQIFANYGVRSCTDVTGFGLLGHLQEICRASSCSAVLECETVPLLGGALSLAEQGISSTLKHANDSALTECNIQPRLLHHPVLTLLTDPQTSGGLLAAVPADQADACLLQLRAEGLPATLIGTVVEAGPARLELH